MKRLSSKEIPVTETLETPKEELTTGSTFAERYQIIEELGKGGMGKVYKVLDKEVNAKIALKLIRPEIAADKKTIERFRNELKIARDISHKNICRMYDLNKEEGSYYITMEYVEGQDLKSLIRQTGQLAIPTTISIAKQVCEGLSEAHKLGTVHRDLKPSNIMINKKGNARIMDFGIARSITGKGITGAGVMVGTPEYMSPEQAEVKEVDQRSDIYSLGVILYEMVTGRVPFEGETPLGIAMKHKSEVPQNPKEINAQIPDDISRQILKCMEKNKEERYQSAAEVLSELIRIEEGIPSTEKVVPKREPKTVKIGEIKWKSLILYGGAVVLLILLIVGGIFLFINRQSPIESIAVLPLKNLSGDSEHEYFADGVTEALITELSKIGALRVISRQSVMRYKGSDKPLPEIARELSVDAVVEGSVLRAGERVRITAQLIRAVPERHLWADNYDRDLDDILILSSEVAQIIAREIQVTLTPEEQTRLASVRPVNPEAYELYVKGQYHYFKWKKEGFEKAIEYFQKAIEADPNYAQAYALLADSFCWLRYLGYLSLKEAYSRFNPALKKALELDDTLPEACLTLAEIRFYIDWDWVGAETEYKRTLELNPNFAWAHAKYAYYLTAMGRSADAIAEAKRALRLDPLSYPANRAFCWVHIVARQYDQAIAQYQQIAELEPKNPRAYNGLASVYEQMGMYEGAVKARQKAMSLSGAKPEEIEALGSAFRESGPNGYWMWRLERLKGQYARNPTSAAENYAQLGDKDQAFAWLEKAYKEHVGPMVTLKVDPAWDPLRSDPRFQDLLRRMNFPD